MSRGRTVEAEIRVGGQNVTGGHITEELRSCDLLMLQETDAALVRRGLGPDWRILWQPGEDPHNCIAWRRSRFQVNGPGEWHRYHGSGKHDPRIPPGIRTPARGLLKQPLMEETTELDLDSYCTHILNSWDPIRGDKWTQTRRMIVETLELPVVRREFRETRLSGRIGVAEADWNSIRNPVKFRGWQQWPDRGLDRHQWTGDGITLIDTEHGPKTGRGPTMQHHSIIVTYLLRSTR